MSQEIGTFDSQDLARFLGIEAGEEQTSQALVDYDYKEAVRKVRQGYVDLLNNYGTTSGSVVEERRWPNPGRLSRFKITSRRVCPSYTQQLDENSIMVVSLKTLEHTDSTSEPYDPRTLTQMLPEDQIELNFHLIRKIPWKSPHRIIYQNLDFYVRVDNVIRYKSIYDSDNPPSKGEVMDEITSGKRDKEASSEELEMLLTARPLLEAYYQSVKSALPAPAETVSEPRPRFRLPLPRLFRH